MNTGPTTVEMKMEIQRMSSVLSAHDVIACFGFGSFFRDGSGSDVDLCIVIADSCAAPGEVLASLEDHLQATGARRGVTFDLTVLLQSEFAQRLLREHDVLVELWREAA